MERPVCSFPAGYFTQDLCELAETLGELALAERQDTYRDKPLDESTYCSLEGCAKGADWMTKGGS